VASRWKRPSAGGRRLALERKFGANVGHYGGAVSLLTLTPPGQDVLPWGDEERLVAGSVGEGNAEFSRLVEYPYREACTAGARDGRHDASAEGLQLAVCAAEAIDAGELADEWVPGHWTPEWRAQVLAVLAVVTPRRGP
jgi:hypothetical protein